MNKYTFEFEHYINQPANKKECWVWWWPAKWYTQPYALTMEGWDLFETYGRTNYPIQYWIRNDVNIFFSVRIMRVREFVQELKYRIKNPRKEMRDIVFPPKWVDICGMVIEFHLQCVLEFVDREKCFEFTDYNSDDLNKKFEKELKEAYDYAKFGRAKLLKQIEDAWNKIPLKGDLYKEKGLSIYDEVTKLEDWLEECDTKLCQWVIVNRNRLWT